MTNLTLDSLRLYHPGRKRIRKKSYDSFAKVALVDTNAAANLFEGENPIGKTVEIGTEPFTVVGILTKREDDMPNIQTLSQYDEYHQEITGSIMIPNKSWPIAFKFDEPENVIIKADSTDNMSAAGKSAEEILNSGISASEESSGSTKIAYKADDVMERVKNLQKLSQSTNQQLIWIASISLLVGGIGVMNIMLVSVTERKAKWSEKGDWSKEKNNSCPVSYRGSCSYEYWRR